MTQLQEFAQRLAEEKYDGSVPNRRSLIRAFLAGFEARDGMEDKERIELLSALAGLVTCIENRITPDLKSIKSLITKIESK